MYFFAQDWVKAVAIRISLNRLNTFGDEVFKDPEVLKSYFYAISDLSVGGRWVENVSFLFRPPLKAAKNTGGLFPCAPLNSPFGPRAA